MPKEKNRYRHNDKRSAPFHSAAEERSPTPAHTYVASNGVAETEHQDRTDGDVHRCERYNQEYAQSIPSRRSHSLRVPGGRQPPEDSEEHRIRPCRVQSNEITDK